ncbi:Hypothetical protein KNT65_gp091 [Escherichia phage EcS1]|uniref:Uncharacterized protein n=1 Tax=Escherichia phage EcS1 TaxID=2083276 RepID=A0A2Z5ZC06_9CAUD|nr:Hypothetical protein KNT65_gp091 [Escherichia phage EcS1]BBC78139.1 Hypothetical protein [Escherichia phage EcS1]
MIIKTSKEMRQYVLDTLRFILRGPMANQLKIEYPLDADMETMFKPLANSSSQAFIGATFINKVAEDFPIIHKFKPKIEFHSIGNTAEGFYKALCRSRAAGAIKAQCKLKDYKLKPIVNLKYGKGVSFTNRFMVSPSTQAPSHIETVCGNLHLNLKWLLEQGSRLVEGEDRQILPYTRTESPSNKYMTSVIFTVEGTQIRCRIQARNYKDQSAYNYTRIRDRFAAQLYNAFTQLDICTIEQYDKRNIHSADFILSPKGDTVSKEMSGTYTASSLATPASFNTFDPQEVKIEIHHANLMRASIKTIDDKLEKNGQERIEIEKRLQKLAHQDANLLVQRDVLKNAIEVLIA